MISLKSYLPAVIGAIATIAAGLFAFYGDLLGSQDNKQLELVEILYKRVESLEDKYEQVVKENKRQARTILDLRIALAKKYDVSATLKEYLDGIPYPAWVKVAEEGASGPIFKMWHINRRYEDVFGVTKGNYVGKTDYQIWPETLADEYYKNDLSVFLRADSRCLLENVSVAFTDGEQRPAKSCKWNSSVEGKSSVSGMIITED